MPAPIPQPEPVFIPEPAPQIPIEPQQIYQPQYQNPAPTILASPEDAITEQERRRAIAEQQAAKQLEEEEIKRLQREARERLAQEEREARELKRQERRSAEQQRRLEELEAKERRRAERDTLKRERELEKQIRREEKAREQLLREQAREQDRNAARQRRDLEKQNREAEKRAKEEDRQRRKEAKDQERQERDEARRRERDAKDNARREQREADRQRKEANQERKEQERAKKREERERRNSPNSNAAPTPQRNPAIAGPVRGGGNPPPSGGTRRDSTGARGWTLAPGSESNSPGKGYDGLILDIRCREAGKSHLECPEYLKAYSGRNAGGYEVFGKQHATPAGSGPRATPRSLGLPVPIGGGARQLGQIGDNSVNGGGPSTSILDDPANSFDRTFPGKEFDYGQNDGARVRDLLEEAEDPWNAPVEITPPPGG